MITIYIALLGYGIIQGSVKTDVKTLLKSVFTIAVIYFFAMNWSNFSEYFVGGIEAGAGHIGDLLISATPVPIPHFAGEGINGAMQSVLIETFKVGQWVWDKGSWHDMGPVLDALIIWGFGFMILAFALFEIVMAKIMLALLFTMAPLFFVFTLFKTTRGFFDKWLGAIAGFSFLLIFVSAALALVLTLFQWGIAEMYTSKAIGVQLVSIIPVILLGFIGIGLIKKVADYAQSFGGHVSTGSGAMMVAGAVGGAVGAALSATRFGMAPLKGLNNFYKDHVQKTNGNAMTKSISAMTDAASQLSQFKSNTTNSEDAK